MTQTTAIKERPILFSSPMVRAILEGRKTQTQRVVKPQPLYHSDYEIWTWERGIGWDDSPLNTQPAILANLIEYCPYGQIGNRLWVRETFYTYTGTQPRLNPKYRYHADDPAPIYGDPDFMADWLKKPSIFLPRAASRITLEITDVRVQRVQDISEEDAVAEGCSAWNTDHARGASFWTARGNFGSLWDEINQARGFGWDTNPWTWVISFKAVTA